MQSTFVILLPRLLRERFPLFVLANLLFLGIAMPASAQQPARLAVIASDPSVTEAADLLTVELSHADQVALLERAQISKVLGEQALSATGTRDYVKLGEILGADGLVILEPANKNGRMVLSSRLVAVKPGAVLWMAEYPLPLADPGPWSKLVAREFQPLFPKLGVLQRDAVPISLLNLRSAVRSAATESLEREMNLLLISRLVREKEVFVLERRNLEALAGEKDFKGLVESPFWNGSYVLDGTIDKNGYNQETVTISARLSPPGKAPMEIEIQGRRAELPQVINEFALKILATLSRRSGIPDWKPEDEAEQYYDEAGWALKWGMLSEAQAAADSAWALGKRTREVAERRIRIYSMAADPNWPAWAYTAPTPQNSAPDFAKLAPATTALQLYEEAFRLFLAVDSKPDMTWYGLGLRLLGEDSELLDQAYYFGQESTREHSGEWAEFRSLVRRTADMLGRHQVYGKLTQSKDQLLVKTRNERAWQIWSGNLDLTTVKAAVGALWLETPEECLEMHREFIRSGELDRVFTYFPYQELIAWNPRDRQRIPELWHGFIQELCDSTNLFTKVEGYILAFADAKPGQEYRDGALRLFRVMADNAFAITSSKRGDGFIKITENFLADHPGGRPGPPLLQEVQKIYYFDFKPEFAFNALLQYVNTDTRFDGNEFSQFAAPTMTSRYFGNSPDRARKLLAALDEYKARLLLKQSEQPFRYNYANYNACSNWLSATLPKETGTAANSREAMPLPVRAGGRGRIPPVELHGAATNVLRVSRFWHVPTELMAEGNDVPSITEARFREGRLWLKIFTGSTPLDMRTGILCGVDLDNFQTEIVDLSKSADARNAGDAQAEPADPRVSFEVLGEYVYISGATQIRRYSLLTKEWEPVPVPGAGTLSLCGRRLFSITKDSILELDGNGKGTKVLASSRRRPAVNQLDALGNFANIFPAPNGSLRTLIGNKVFTQSQGGGDWSETTSLPESQEWIRSTTFEGGLLAKWTNPDQPTQWLTLADDRPSFETLLLEPRSFHQPQIQVPIWRPGGVPSTSGIASKARWKHPPGMALDNAATAFDGDNLWFFAGSFKLETNRAGGAVLQEEAGRNGLLLEFKKDLPEACIVPLRFDLEEGLISPALVDKLLGARVNTGQGMKIVRQLGGVVFKPTPQGIVVSARNMPGFWLIPRSDLESRLDAMARQQSEEIKGRSQAAEQQWTELLSRHKIDHRDTFTPGEKEEMIDDPELLALELTNIDVNRNGSIDAQELAYFDANQNGILEPREMSALKQVWGLLAAQIMKDYDANGDGELDASEVPLPGVPDRRSDFVFPRESMVYLRGTVLDGTGSPGRKAVTLADLKNLQQRLTESSLSQARDWQPARRMPPAPGGNSKTLVTTGINELVELYWKQHAASAEKTPAATGNSGK